MVDLDFRVFVDPHIYDHYGYKPMDVAGVLFEKALDNAGIVWASTYDPAIPVDSRNYSNHSDLLNAFRSWLDDEGILGAEDCQHLVFDSSSWSDGGNGVASGTTSVGIGELLNNLSSINPPRFEEMDHGGPHTEGDEMHITLHEMGHTLGLSHGDGMHYDGGQVGWTVPDYTDACYTTALQAGRDGGDNNCGEDSVDPDYYGTEYVDAYYWDTCEGDIIRTNFY